jgi:FkbM family methyltransferase
MAHAARWGDARNPALAELILLAIRRRIMPGKFKRPALRTFARLGGVVDIERDGLKLRCHLGDNATERRLALKPEAPDTELNAIMARLKRGDTFVDVGANCGWFSINAARAVGKDGRVVAIEPLPVLRDRLAFNVAANDQSNVEIVPAAISDQPGTLTINVNKGQLGQSSAVDWQAGNVPMNVPARTLASVITMQRLDRVDAMKIDIEGFEDRALLPMLRTLPHTLWPRAILIETRHAARWHEDCLAALLSAGYTTTWNGEFDALLILP